MRRISTQYAQPGMVLSTDMYDHFGNLVMMKGTRLTFDNVSTLGRMGGGELFFDDDRVDDVPVTPLIPPQLEGNTSRKLNTFINELSKALKGTGTQKACTDPLEKVAYGMVGQLFPIVIGEPNSTGCFSLKDYDYVHPVQVAELSILMGRKLGYSQADLFELGLAALLENIGYLALAPGLLDEPTSLTSIEKHEVNQHTQYGYQILGDYTDTPPNVIMTVLDHHERWDGSGFPRGLKREAISTFARIIAITDTYYALVSRRPHRQSYLPHEAIEFVMAYSGELFDPELTRLFSRILPLYPTGVMVNLNTGEQGIISNAQIGHVGRPVVRVCYDKELKEIKKPFDIDLTESQHQHRLVASVIEY
jgi:HD-GYP domain-containing protein (c-di-GMP phosphodiesterase class II)